eukprot:scaffold56646_cov33-Phaeocystis_antarctica.AAC.1
MRTSRADRSTTPAPPPRSSCPSRAQVTWSASLEVLGTPEQPPEASPGFFPPPPQRISFSRGESSGREAVAVATEVAGAETVTWAEAEAGARKEGLAPGDE